MSRTGKPNVLLIIADDLGQDVLRLRRTGGIAALDVVTYDPVDGEEIRGALPNISLLLRNGVRFESAWAQAACSPTRASIFTGLHPWKHGVGSPEQGYDVLSATSAIATLPEMLPSEYACGLFGKWHLGEDAGSRPTDHGWDAYQGSLGGALKGRLGVLSQSQDYTRWVRFDSDTDYAFGYDSNGEVELEQGHASWVTVRDAANWINDQGDAPWFATVAFNAPHDPFHVPSMHRGYDVEHGFDPNTHGAHATNLEDSSDAYKFNVMTQNMDWNIGLLLGATPYPGVLFDFPEIASAQLDNTIVVFLGDNGSPKQVAPGGHKGEPNEGGIHVPMIIADGRAVLQEFGLHSESPTGKTLATEKLGKRSLHMVHVVDLYKTIVRLADPESEGFSELNDSMDLSPICTEASSVMPERTFNFSQYFSAGKWFATIRNRDYKLNYQSGENLEDDYPPGYSLFRYQDNQIPGDEVPRSDEDMFFRALKGIDTEAEENLNTLLDELTANYKLAEDRRFPDPREPFVIFPR